LQSTGTLGDLMKTIKGIAVAVAVVVFLYLLVATFLPEYMIAGFKFRRFWGR
jgi:hypothetical protein